MKLSKLVKLSGNINPGFEQNLFLTCCVPFLLDNVSGHTANIAEVRTPLDVNVFYINLNFILLHPIVFFCIHLDFMDMVRILDRSHETIMDYWRSLDILKGININTAWEEVSVKCLKGVWGKRLPQFTHDIMGLEPLGNTLDDVNRPAQ